MQKHYTPPTTPPTVVNLNAPDPEPPMALQAFCEKLAVSATTVWRWRRMGWLETVNIAGRPYVTREEVRRFNARVATGEFSRPIVCAANNRRRAAA